MQRSTKKIKPEVDYRQFRFKKMNTPEFSHVKLLLFWPFFGLMFPSSAQNDMSKINPSEKSDNRNGSKRKTRSNF